MSDLAPSKERQRDTLIRARFRTTPSWADLQHHFPRFAAALEADPIDRATIEQRGNALLWEMFQDAQAQAERLLP